MEGVRISETDAAELATELEARAAAGHVVDHVKWEPPRQVEAATWTDTGTVDVWIRDRGEWYARVTDDTGRVRWVLGRDLRPA